MSKSTRARAAFTLMELVSAMAAAALLLSGLAAAVLVTNRSLEDAATPVTRNAVLQEVADRITEDARHASTIQLSSQSIAMTLPDRDGDGLSESVTYQFGTLGLTRNQSLHPAVSFLTTPPSIATQIDGYTSPTLAVPAVPVRLHGWASSTTTNRAWLTSVEVPRDSRAGDLLVLILVGDESWIGPWGGTWTSVEFYEQNDVYLSVFMKSAGSNEAVSQNVFAYSFDGNVIASQCLCFSGAGRSMFDDNVLRTHGYANPVTGTGLPQPLELATVPAHAMNLQILAFEGNPVASMSMGFPGFSDVSVTTATLNGNNILTLASMIRNGKSTASPVPTVALATACEWSQVAMQWWP